MHTISNCVNILFYFLNPCRRLSDAYSCRLSDAYQWFPSVKRRFQVSHIRRFVLSVSQIRRLYVSQMRRLVLSVSQIRHLYVSQIRRLIRLSVA